MKPRRGFFIVLPILAVIVRSDFDISDDRLYELHWSGPQLDEELKSAAEAGLTHVKKDRVIVTTANREKYKCTIPSVIPEESVTEHDSIGPSPEEIIGRLNAKQSCVYRFEPYWTYELCHGRHIRQYHEEKEAGKEVKLQEYFLGKFTKPKDSKNKDASTETPSPEDKIPTKRLDGKDVPYYEVIMDDGTPCDLKKNQARLSKLLYICDPEATQEAFSVEEVTTCEYEIMVITAAMCKSRIYSLQETPTQLIHCHPLAGSPVRPKALVELHKKDARDPSKETTSSLPKQPQAAGTPVNSYKITPEASKSIDLATEELITRFLEGDYCLHGGQGWWKYEFCYGKYALQYHQEDKSRTDVVLGNWNLADHKEWWKKNKVQTSSTLVHLYTNGDFCELTGVKRFVQVRFKCKKMPSPHAITIYLVEPNTCEYVLTIESGFICDLLDTVNEFGLFQR